MIWGAMSSAGVGPLCFLKTNVTDVNQDILEHFMLPSADQLFKDAHLIFQQDLAPVHTAKSTKSWLNDHGVGVLDWPAKSPDLNPIEQGFAKSGLRSGSGPGGDSIRTRLHFIFQAHSYHSDLRAVCVAHTHTRAHEPVLQ